MKIINERNYREIMTSEVEPFLSGIRDENTFTSFDGNKISYEAYRNPESKGAVLVLHGFTESAEKFREVTYYLYNAGYDVYAPDLRGHGNSYRTSKKTGTVNADSFDAYEKDTERFIDGVIAPGLKGKPLYIYSHSLGSTAAILYMESHPGTVKKAVLSSPMICGNMGMPVGVAYTVARLLCALGGKNISAPGRCRFDPEQTYENSDSTSKARFDYYHEKRKNNPLLQTNGPSFSWVRASVEARDKALGNAQNIKAELLIFKPQEDRQLLEEYQDMFIERLQGARVVQTEGSKHEIFGSTDDVLEKYYEEILKFFG